ncbi:MAG: hypothetical protein H7175_02675 [Burkholderiales bacterium]|nr:hypothetical protein [Anaerolineae bacterium]
MSKRNETIIIGRAVRKEDGALLTFYDDDTALVEHHYRKGVPVKAEYVNERIRVAYTLAASEMIEAVWNAEEYGPLMPMIPAPQPPPED